MLGAVSRGIERTVNRQTACRCIGEIEIGARWGSNESGRRTQSRCGITLRIGSREGEAGTAPIPIGVIDSPVISPADRKSMRAVERDCLLKIDVETVTVIQGVLVFAQTLEVGGAGCLVNDLVIVGESSLRKVADFIGSGHVQLHGGAKAGRQSGHHATAAKIPPAKG